ACLSLETAPDDDPDIYDHAAVQLWHVLTAAADPLGLEAVPIPRDISSALTRWYWQHRESPARDARQRARRRRGYRRPSAAVALRPLPRPAPGVPRRRRQPGRPSERPAECG